MISEGFPQAQRVLCPLVRVRARANDAEQLHGQSDSTGKWREPTLSMKSLSMRKLKEVLRLRFVLELGQRQIARSCSIEQGTVYEYLKRAQAAGVTTWSLPEGWDDRRLEEVLFGGTPRRAYESRKPAPDFCATPRRTPTPSSPDAAIGLGRVSPTASRRLCRQPVLRALTAVAAATGYRAATGAQGGREALR